MEQTCFADIGQRETRLVQEDIKRTNLTQTPLFTNLDETDTINELIAQYLAHEGFMETGRQFSHDIQEQKQALNPGMLSAPSPIETDNTSATNRQSTSFQCSYRGDTDQVIEIRAAILRGDVDRAFKYLGACFPGVVESEANRDIYFHLRCRKFIEMILRSYEVQATGLLSSHGQSEGGTSQTTNGNGDMGQLSQIAGSKTEGMDLDGHVSRTGDSRMDLAESDSMELSTDSLKSLPAFAETKSAALMHNELLTAAIQYGMELQAEFSNDPRKEVKKALSDTFALIAYTDARESVLAEMMEGKGRIEIAEQVNGAILGEFRAPHIVHE